MSRSNRLLVTGTLAWLWVLPGSSAGAMEPTLDSADAGPEAAAAAAEPQTDRIIVKYREAAPGAAPERGPQNAEAFSTDLGISLEYVQTTGTDAQVLALPEPVSIGQAQAIAEQIAQDPNVQYAEPDAVMQIQQVSDERFGEQWHYSEAGTGINLEAGWQYATGGGAIVAVIDTGVVPHEDIDAQLLPGHDFISDVAAANDGDGRDADASDPGDWCPPLRPTSSWHGLHVAGTIAAITDNKLGVAGIARDAKILPIRVLGKCGGFLSDISDGMLWAAGIHVDGVPDNPNPARVLNLSLGGPGACGPTYSDAIRRIRDLGVAVVVAAGNSDSDASGFRPANCDGVITVAATNRQGGRAFFGRPGAGSNFGAMVEIAAPGGETRPNSVNGILSTLNEGLTTPAAAAYEFYQGTSMAAPHVAGVVGLLYGANPAITPDEAVSVLQQTSQPFPVVAVRPCSTSECGAGIVDAGAAVSSTLKTARSSAAQ